jgi:hypothetical protein
MVPSQKRNAPQGVFFLLLSEACGMIELTLLSRNVSAPCKKKVAL